MSGADEEFLEATLSWSDLVHNLARRLTDTRPDAARAETGWVDSVDPPAAVVENAALGRANRAIIEAALRALPMGQRVAVTLMELP